MYAVAHFFEKYEYFISYFKNPPSNISSFFEIPIINYSDLQTKLLIIMKIFIMKIIADVITLSNDVRYFF